MSIKMKELPTSERPYEKLVSYGAEMLSNAELLAIIIKTGNKGETSITVAQKILNLSKNLDKDNLRFLHEISLNEFIKIKGIGRVKAMQLKAICELSKRMSRPINSNMKIKKATDIASLLMPELRNEKRELAKVVILNNRNIIQRIVDISLEGTNFACIELKDVLVDAIKMQSPKIILVHNHPSGDSTPSSADFRVTDRIYESASIMGIELLDHIVIGDGTFNSILREGEKR